MPGADGEGLGGAGGGQGQGDIARRARAWRGFGLADRIEEGLQRQLAEVHGR